MSNFAYYNPNTGCVSECKLLYEKLRNIGIKTYFVSCKANGFSNPAGDRLVKEAHVFLLYPSLRNEKVYFTIFDPGFRMLSPISFYDRKNSLIVKYHSKGEAKVKFHHEGVDYSYELYINSRLDYKRQLIDANIHWYFNPYYETLNLDDYNEKVYHAMFSLKLMNYPCDLSQYLCIRSKILERTVEIYSLQKQKLYSYEQLFSLDMEQLKNVFREYFINANLSFEKLDRFITNLFLLVHNVDIYVENIIDSEVIKDYVLGKKLNR